MMSAKQRITRTVSATVSPLDTDDELASEKPMTLPAQLHHGRGETQARTGRGLVEERRQLLSLARLAVFGTVGDDVLRQRNDLFGFGNRQVGRID